jgi:hypothetical protein
LLLRMLFFLSIDCDHYLLIIVQEFCILLKMTRLESLVAVNIRACLNGIIMCCDLVANHLFSSL